MKPNSARTFLVRLLAVTLALLLLMGGIMVAVDPFSHYRPNEGYILNDRFCMPSLIEFGDYDAALIGSSMCQNFDMELMRQRLQVEPLKAVKGGLNLEETEQLNSWIRAAGKAKKIYLNVDLTRFSEGAVPSDYYPSYLTNDSVMDDYLYLFGYEAWMRYLPLDLLSLGMGALHRKLPSSLQKKTDPDLIGYWADRAVFGESEVLRKYKAGTDAVSDQVAEGLFERMASNLDAFLERKPFADETVEYIVFMSPYSALYWARTKNLGYFDALCKFRSYYCERLNEYDNVALYDFQAMPEITDLANYKDTSHFCPEMNDRMVESFATGEGLSTAQTVAENNAFLSRSADEMLARYPELFLA